MTTAPDQPPQHTSMAFTLAARPLSSLLPSQQSRRLPQSLNFWALGVIRMFFPIVAMLFLAHADLALCADTAIKPSDEEPLNGLLAGEYDLIGRKPDSTTTYTGRVTLRAEGADLAVVRTVNGKTLKGIARFETVAGADRIPVLRMHLVLDGVEYRATYRWQTDPDNYVRLTGILFRDGTKSSGLEALFPIHQ